MGNNHSNHPSNKVSRSIRHRSSKLSRSRKSKGHEAFFIAHHHQTQSPITPISPTMPQIDLQKRVIFVSLMGIYQSWTNCPSHLLYSSIFILPLKKQWVFQPEKHLFQHDFERVLHDTDFVKLLKWKDDQGLVFWMKDTVPTNDVLFNKYSIQKPVTPDFVGDDDEDLFDDNDGGDDDGDDKMDIAPFWKYLSYQLSLLYDPVTGTNYKPLLLDNNWWNNKYIKESESKFNATCDQIKKELFWLTMKFKAMSEILYQSNPSSFNIVTTYSLNENSMNCESIEISQKSYNSLPDRKLNEITSNTQQTNIDINNELNINGEITPNPDSLCSEYDICCDDDKDDKDDKDDNNNNDKNVWWVSSEYDEDVGNHDNDALYNDDNDGAEHDEN